MNATDLRGLDADAIQTKVKEWQEQAFRMRCEKKVGNLENTNTIKETRRNIARALTILREKQDAANQS
jgi:large subunit ribosomal protein L29